MLASRRMVLWRFALLKPLGAITGAPAQTFNQVRENRPDSQFSIQGLFHCGDDSGKNLVGVGTELAAQSGLNCADLILRTREFSKD